MTRRIPRFLIRFVWAGLLPGLAIIIYAHGFEYTGVGLAVLALILGLEDVHHVPTISMEPDYLNDR